MRDAPVRTSQVLQQTDRRVPSYIFPLVAAWSVMEHEAILFHRKPLQNSHFGGKSKESSQFFYFKQNEPQNNEDPKPCAHQTIVVAKHNNEHC